VSRLLDWLLGRGRDPLALESPPARAESPSVAATDEQDDSLRAQAQALGVSVDMLRTMHGARRELVQLVAADPRTWGFDLAPPGEGRRDLATEFRQRTRLTGTIGASFLQDHEPLLACAPNPLTMPDGIPLDGLLREQARLDVDSARDLAGQLRATVQASLGRPLDHAAVEHAVREVAWDHELDAAQVAPLVLRAMSDVLEP
jgi:hypothetical protein